MDQSKGWGPSRYAALCLVSAIHVILLLALLMGSRTPVAPRPAAVTVELLNLPRTIPPKIFPEISRPRRLNADTALSLTPPVPDLTSLFPLPQASISDGDGRGVDWRAEARRALEAYEIRGLQPPLRDSLSGSPADEYWHWWPRARHHAGEQFKTSNGDWIVWINDACYQVATASANANAPGTVLPRTVCSTESGVPRSVVFERSTVTKDGRTTN
jgi:hypothetical protein